MGAGRDPRRTGVGEHQSFIAIIGVQWRCNVEVEAHREANVRVARHNTITDRGDNGTD
jgi:hypothetical protein